MHTEIFFTSVIPKIPCNATDLVKNTRSKATVRKVEDTNKVKNGVLSARYSLDGMDFGALVADVC